MLKNQTGSLLFVAEEWCVGFSGGDIGAETCLSPEWMILAVVIELGIYVLVGAGVWGAIKRYWARKSEKRRQTEENKRNWLPQDEK